MSRMGSLSASTAASTPAPPTDLPLRPAGTEAGADGRDDPAGPARHATRPLRRHQRVSAPIRSSTSCSTGPAGSYVNIGAPTDACEPSASESEAVRRRRGPCPACRCLGLYAAGRRLFPALKPGDANPPREIFARGLRNSMALAVHPLSDEGFPSCRARTPAICPTR